MTFNFLPSNYLEITLKVLVIIVLGGLVGLDREIKHKPAGIKTHILVGLGSTIMMLVSLQLYYDFIGKAQVDPGRIAAQVVTGIGFLGAGTILQSKGSVIGLTTAASLWSVAGIGLAVGAGMYYLAVLASVLMIIIFAVVNNFTDMVENKAVVQLNKVRDKIKKAAAGKRK
ncbi:MAG: MgtC/SapB family protein [bacterium]